ncbi:hypothetical protein E2C01_065893 [Portunus trituberculatus]|uniref:Uncharacterized protein n=1 Tax=Portunus trituberculatus TaxID=210409 RepID=A0A5B7HPI8_PORTR|nr:hypothetical protein [Portunus trituberculatus]
MTVNRVPFLDTRKQDKYEISGDREYRYPSWSTQDTQVDPGYPSQTAIRQPAVVQGSKLRRLPGGYSGPTD